MKKTNLFIKLIAAALVVGLAAVLFAGCGASQEIALVFEMDGKVYTMTEEEFDILLKNRKRTYFVNLLYPSSKDIVYSKVVLCVWITVFGFCFNPFIGFGIPFNTFCLI